MSSPIPSNHEQWRCGKLQILSAFLSLDVEKFLLRDPTIGLVGISLKLDQILNITTPFATVHNLFYRPNVVTLVHKLNFAGIKTTNDGIVFIVNQFVIGRVAIND